jgi:hypothetical protein
MNESVTVDHVSKVFKKEVLAKDVSSKNIFAELM